MILCVVGASSERNGGKGRDMRARLLCIVAIAVVTSTSPIAQAEPAYTNKLLDIAVTGAKCPAKVGPFSSLAQAAEAAKATDQAADIYMTLASCYGEMGQLTAGARALAKAVSLGSDDCNFMATDAGLKRLPNHGAMMSRMKISPADAEELIWLTTEISAVQNETTMMIAANINRKDGDLTKSFAPTLPPRKQNSPAVRIYRWTLVYIFNYQRSIVTKSDNARIKHLVNMNIINNMGTGGGYLSQRQISRSIQLANRAAAQRQRASQRRAFRSTKRSTRKVSCNRL